MRQKPASREGGRKLGLAQDTVRFALTAHVVEIGLFMTEGKNLMGSELPVETNCPLSVVNSPLAVKYHVRAICGLELTVPPRIEMYRRSARLVRPSAT